MAKCLKESSLMSIDISMNKIGDECVMVLS